MNAFIILHSVIYRTSGALSTESAQNGTNLPLLWTFQWKKLFSFRGAPWLPDQGLFLLGLHPQTPIIGSRSCTRNVAPKLNLRIRHCIIYNSSNASDSWWKGGNAPTASSQDVREERTRPGHWFWLALCVPSMLWYLWFGDRKDIWPIKTCSTSPIILKNRHMSAAVWLMATKFGKMTPLTIVTVLAVKISKF